jgi:hypothetical protein
MPKALQLTIVVHNDVARIYRPRLAIAHLHRQSCPLTDIIRIRMLRAVIPVTLDLDEQRVLRRWEQVIDPAAFDEVTIIEVEVLTVSCKC